MLYFDLKGKRQELTLTDFSITPCGKAVLVANQDSGHIRVFSRDVASGTLTMTDEIYEIPAPNYIRFVNFQNSQERHTVTYSGQPQALLLRISNYF